VTLPKPNLAPRRVYFVSLGCAKNQVDTEVMLGVVRDEGHELVDDPADADTLVVNTCGFIEAAKEESIDAIIQLGEIKREAGGDPKLIVSGCLSQRYPTELAKEMPEVDHFLGSADMLGLRGVLRGEARRMGVSELSRRAYLYDHQSPRQTYGARHFSYVKIAEGCDRPCAFCIIPKLRGPQRSRTVYSVVEEVSGLVAQGTREVCLVAQDLTTYGTDLEERGLAPANLEQLLDALNEIEGLEWIRLHYAYPTAVTEGLIQRISDHERVAPYLDVPLQHVDTDVLKKMRRGYTEKVVRDFVDRIRAAPTPIWLRTTLLVGHPGETEEAYGRLRDFIAHGQIDHLGVFPWSREDGTVSAMQPGRIDDDVAQARASELMELQAGIRLQKHLAMTGQLLEVMIDGASDESEFLLDGRHVGQAPDIDGKVIVCDVAGELAPGTMVKTRVLEANAHDLVVTMDLDRDPDDA
jgi:ribosomal protein S12 methylthiotransferase